MLAGGKGRKEKQQDLPGRRRTIYPGPTIAMDWSPPCPQSLPTRHGQWSSILAVPTVRNNCSGHYPLLSGAASTSFFRSQVCVGPLEINKNGTGREERPFLTQNRLVDGPELVYGYKWGPGDTTASVSYYTFVACAYSPNGTFHRRILHDVSMYEEYAYGGFACLVADNYLT
jgi:hypothetical protein